MDRLIQGLNADTALVGKGDLPRLLVMECIPNKKNDAPIRVLSDFVVREFRARSAALESQKIEILSRATDAVACLRALGGQPLRADVVKWLFASNDRLKLLADSMTEKDNSERVSRIIQGLYDHDAAGRDVFFNLILAMAVVWDQERPIIHDQTGESPPASDPAIEARYDYFKKIYSSNQGKALYPRLDVRALCFVVDTPAPLSELEWALDNARGSPSGWSRKFNEIKYDQKRIETGSYSWPHGEYTLASIREHGGICVDQAYYATLTARAHGIPAIFFRGPGRRGGHAWFAYMKGENQWEMDVGRYAYDKYATGHATDPQTNESMTDHDVEYTCEHSLRSRQFDLARAYAGIAKVLLEAKEHEQAIACAHRARELAKRYEAPWDIEISAWEQEGKLETAVSALDDKASFFSRYPDIVMKTREKQAQLLRQMGRKDEADRLLDKLSRRIDEDRDDLARQIAKRQINEYMADGDAEGARRKMEKLLESQINERQKVAPMINEYLDLTRETGQTREAARFLDGYVKQILQLRLSTEEKRMFLSFLLHACRNDKDEKGVRDAERDLKRLEEPPERVSPD